MRLTPSNCVAHDCRSVGRKLGQLPSYFRVWTIHSLCLCVLVGCDGLGIDTYWKDGRFELIAVDVRWQMELRDTTEPSRSLIGPTVFAVGASDRYVVAKQHPFDVGGVVDRSVTNYFIVTRNDDAASFGIPAEVQGPLAATEYMRIATKLDLPAFSKSFPTLE